LLTIAHLHQSLVIPVSQFFSRGAIKAARLSTNRGDGEKMERRQAGSDVLRQLWLCLKHYWND